MANAENIEKMQAVVNSLRSDPKVVVVGGYERTYLSTGEWPNPNGYWSRTLDIFTHPKDPIYEADELNTFMFNLVPELTPTCSDRFFGGGHGYRRLELGTLYFDESIGTAALSATVRINEGLSVVTSGMVAPEWTTGNTLDLKQRTWVRVFPDAGHLADAAEGHNLHSIPVNDLRRRGAGRVVAGLLEAPILGSVIESNQHFEIKD